MFKSIIASICVKILSWCIDKNKTVVFLTDEEFKEYCEFRDSVFIIYENEQELKNDWPDAKQIIKK